MAVIFNTKPKCKTCGRKFKKDEAKHIIRLETHDGVAELEICEECADFWDLSADVLMNKGRDDGKSF
jgi:ribosome-binding protein aMBF1 (putative translation factor)